MGHASDPALILRDLRRARHRRHREDVDWVETLYRVYVTVLIGATAVWLSASKVTDKAAQPGGLADIQAHGAAALGVLAGFLVALGIRSGSRGGPLSLEAADVRVVLLSPISRRLALRAPALHQLRSAAFTGLCVGIVAGNLAGNRLPGRFIGWVVAGAAFGLLTAVLAVGAALVACGIRLNRPAGTALGAALLGWSAADVAAGSMTSPLTLLGRMALAPLPGEVSGGSVVASVVGGVGLTAAVLVVAALRLGHISLEAAERRGRLAAQLRFALSLQDLRTVILLRRRLASEEPRGRPWFKLGNRGGGKRTPSAAVRRRTVQSLLRWPAPRILRVGGLGVIAGLAAGGAWKGTTPLVIVAGAALFIAALDALEPLAQEWDHPTRRDSFPVPPSWLAAVSLPAPALVLLVVTAAGAAVAIPVLGVPVGPMTAVVFPATAGALAGATASLVLEPVSAAELMSRYQVPEAAGPMVVARLGFAPGLAISGWLPLLAGRALIGDEKIEPMAIVVQSGAFAVGVSVLLIRALCQHFERKRAIPEP